MEFINYLVSGVTSIAIHTLRLVLLTLYRPHLPYHFETHCTPLPTYDFIVVGGGAAGSVVAGRLAEAGALVLLLEAGPSAPPESAVPGLNPLLISGDRDWRMRTAPQPHSQFAYHHNSVPLPLGKCMGGGSTINGLQYVRGSPQDFDYWASLGNHHWDFESVLPFFKKSEDFRGKITPKTARFRGQGGRYRVEPKRFSTALQAAFLQAGKELGYEVIDPNAGSQLGFSSVQVTVREALRSSTSEAFLRPLVGLRNLHVQPLSTVTKILFNKGKRAIGVRFQQGKKMRLVKARKEVVLCAGAINSPKLLMLSGIGPADHLAQMGIPVVAEVDGVGRNFNDHHVINTLVWTVRRGAALPLDLYTSPHTYVAYARHHTGFLSSPFAIEGNAWVSLGSDRDRDWPNVQVLAAAASPAYDRGSSSRAIYGLKKPYFENLYGSLGWRQTIQFGVMLSRPKSRGRVLLQSRNPAQPPIIHPNFLHHPDDMKNIIAGTTDDHFLLYYREEVGRVYSTLGKIPSAEVMCAGIKFALAIGNTTAVREGLGAKLHFRPLLGCEAFVPLTDPYWECYVRHLLTSFWHPAGTCKMAPPAAPDGVVSPRLRLRGVSGVRVVDASVMPQVTTGNTMATTVMIGERGASFILEDWGYPRQT